MWHLLMVAVNVLFWRFRGLVNKDESNVVKTSSVNGKCGGDTFLMIDF